MSRFRPSRWDLVWIVGFTVLFGLLIFGDAPSRAHLLGRTTEHTAEVVRVDPGPRDACSRHQGEKWLVTVAWAGGEGGFSRCDDTAPFQVGESVPVWTYDGDETLKTSSPTDQRIVLAMLPLVPYLFIVVMPALLLPMRTRIRESAQRRRASG